MKLLFLILGVFVYPAISQMVHIEEDFYTIESNIDLSNHETFCQHILISIADMQQNKIFNEKSKPLLRKVAKVLTSRTLNLLYKINKLGIEEKEIVENITGGEVKPVLKSTTTTTTTTSTTTTTKKAKTYHNVYKHHMNNLNVLESHVNDKPIFTNGPPSYHHIHKRSFDFLGNIVHWVTGIPGPDQYNQLVSQQHKIKSRVKSELKKEKKSDDSLNLYKHELDRDMTYNDKALQDFKSETQEIIISTDANAQKIALLVFKSTCEDYIRNMEEKIGNIQAIIETSRSNRLSERLISHTKLRKIVKDINSKTRQLTPVFSLKEIHHYYDIHGTNVRREGRFISIYSRIPLINPDHSAFLRPISPATKTATGTRSDFIVINKEHPHYSTVNYNDLDKFIYISNFGYISSLRHIEIYMQNTIMPEKNLEKVIIERAELNGYTFQLDKEEEAITRCMDNVTKIVIPKNAFLHIPSHCTLSSSIVFIHKFEQKGVEIFQFDNKIELVDLSDSIYTFNNIEDKRFLNTRHNYPSYVTTQTIEDHTEQTESNSIPIVAITIACIAAMLSLANTIYMVLAKMGSKKEKEDIEMKGNLKFDTSKLEILEAKIESIILRHRTLSESISTLETSLLTKTQDMHTRITKGKELFLRSMENMESMNKTCMENNNKRQNSIRELDNKLRALDLNIVEMENRRLGLGPKAS